MINVDFKGNTVLIKNIKVSGVKNIDQKYTIVFKDQDNN